MTRVAALLLAITLCVLPSGPTPSASARDTPSHPLVVTGYALPGLKASVVRRDAHALDIVGVSGLTVRQDGSGLTRSYPMLRRQVRTAHHHGLRAELLVSNWSAVTGDFDPRLATRLLGVPAHRAAAVRRLVRTVDREGWDGVTLDLEAMRARDRAGLVALVRELRAALPESVPLSMAIGARSSPASYRSSGFSLRRLARHLDRVALMTYDQHGATWSGPGPVGALPWQRRTMAVLLRQVPRRKVDLGIAGYGYTWPTSGTGGSISPRRARARVADDGATAVWHPRAGEWSATLSDGTVLWWSDVRSYRKRLALARELQLHGVALWVLGSADPLP